MSESTGFTSGATLAVYKEHAALNIQFAPARKNYAGYPEPGGFMLAFAKATGNTSGAKYDWENAIKMFLNVNETTTFIRMLKEELKEGSFGSVRIYHDPDKGQPNEGTRAKKLSVGAARDNGKFLNMECSGTKVSVVLGVDEITYISAALSQAIPGCLGWTSVL